MSDLWTPQEIFKATGGVLHGQITKPLNGVAIDSRTLAEGDIFIAIKGDVHDGHKFVSKALETGAGLAVVSKLQDDMLKAGPVLVVNDTLGAMEDLGRFSRQRSKAKIIAITGSVGKTSSKDALAAGLAQSGKTHASKASFNNHWGVPLTLARMPRDCEFAVFEIGMNHSGEIAELVKMVRPHIALVTTIAESHLGHFANIEEIAEAKAEIFTGMEDGGSVVLNQDNRFFDLLKKRAREHGVEDIVGFGRGEACDIRLEKSVLHNSCSCISADVLGEKLTFKLAVPGEHMVMNTLGVLGAIKLAGGDLARAGLAMAQISPPKGRGVRHQLGHKDGSFLLIDESYNANPTSMRAALAVLGRAEPKAGGRRIAILGDMLELGNEATRLHLGLAEPIDAANVDQVFACGAEMQHLFEALPPFRRGEWAVRSQDLQSAVLAQIKPGDVVMIKGSLGSRMGLLVDAIKERFSGADEAA